MANQTEDAQIILAEAEVLKSAELHAALFQTLFELAPDAMVLVDGDQRIVLVNAQAEQMFGRQRQSLLGQPVDGLFPPRFQGLFSLGTAGTTAPSGPGSTADRDLACQRQAGQEFPVELRISPVMVGPVSLSLGIIRDVAQLRTVQLGLLASERLAALGEMATGLAHESRNALQQIGACSEMLLMELRGQPEAIDLVQGVQEAEVRLQQLFNDLRAYAAPLKLRLQSIDVGEIWRKAWRQLAEQRGISAGALVEQVDGLELICEVDSSSLGQAFFNILENALDAAGPDVHVTVVCRETLIGDRAALHVNFVDNGPGMGAEKQPRVFEPFFTTKTQGSGLGLPIARRVIEAHGGRLEVGRAALGGTQVSATVPRRADSLR